MWKRRRKVGGRKVREVREVKKGRAEGREKGRKDHGFGWETARKERRKKGHQRRTARRKVGKGWNVKEEREEGGGVKGGGRWRYEGRKGQKKRWEEWKEGRKESEGRKEGKGRKVDK